MKSEFFVSLRARLTPFPIFSVTFVLSFIINIIAVLYQIHALLPSTESYSKLFSSPDLRLLLIPTPPTSLSGGDHPRELPLFLRTVNMAVHNDEEHYAILGERAEGEWDAIRPPGGGDVYLGQSPYPFSVSLWHQLQCLNHIRRVLAYGDDGTPYTAHCFNYLRQAFLCGADITLEPGGTQMINPHGPGTIAPTVNRTHTCRDWTRVYNWTVEQHAKWTPEMVRLQKDLVNDTFLEMPEGF
ncbi:hypothetical protein EW146_g2629 [Bondarzewia mesenterica]|uniref:Uncharacterized protein n=1 Tax=Bondarzewia mesenterica TaxID=1095465 RepID=A0A4S4M0B1_9AGAM|nr:hypothetical protein EW146_g2629 [Bondarzewia mesenterica]